MKIENQPSSFYRGIGSGKSLGFFQRANPKYKEAGKLTAVTERPGNDEFLQLIEPDDVRQVGLLQSFSLRSFLWRPFRSAHQKSEISGGHFVRRRGLLHYVLRPPRMHFHYQAA